MSTEYNILWAATEVFAKDGFEGASVREICKLAKINISMISYYFGGKKGLYEKVVAKIAENVINYMRNALSIKEMPENFNHFSKQERISFLNKALENLLDYFYSDKISDSEIMIFFREQITAGIPLNVSGYNMFRKLLASILDKDEHDKEVIFRCITIIGQIHSARIFKQFSLKNMNQKQYNQEDNLLFKNIVISQVKAILKDLGALDEE